MKYYLSFFCSLFFLSCSSLTEEELWIKVEQAKANNNWDSTMMVSQMILREFPQGPYAGWARFALAESHRFKNHPREALIHYKIVTEQYPELQPAAVSLFLVGFIYANNLQAYDSARWFYREFLTKYPNHDLVPSIQLELETMGISPETVLEERMKRQQSIGRK